MILFILPIRDSFVVSNGMYAIESTNDEGTELTRAPFMSTTFSEVGTLSSISEEEQLQRQTSIIFRIVVSFILVIRVEVYSDNSNQNFGTIDPGK